MDGWMDGHEQARMGMDAWWMDMNGWIEEWKDGQVEEWKDNNNINNHFSQ